MNVSVRFMALALFGLVGFLSPGCGSESQEPIYGGSPITTPDEPTEVRAEAGDRQATVTWKASAGNGGRHISKYTVKVFSGGTEVVPPVSVEPPPLEATVTGLTNGTAYTFKVFATTSEGDSEESLASAAVIPHVVPGAPQNVAVTPGDRQVVVTWAAAEDKGMPITGYVVSARAGEAEVSQTVTGTSATFTGLTNGTAYTFSVVADNGVVRGPPGAAESTPFTRPGAPQVTTSNFIRQVTVRWTLENTGGSPITGYTVLVYQGDTLLRTEHTTETRLVVEELTNGTTYHFVVFATNAAGDGVPSERVPGRAQRGPSMPLAFTCTPGDRQLTFTWTPPLEDHGDPVLEYRLGTLINNDTALYWYTPELSYTVTGLTNGVDYTFSLTARNAVGYGDSARLTFCTPAAP